MKLTEVKKMSLSIDIEDETNEILPEQTKQIVDLLQFAAKRESLEGEVELSMMFVTNERIQQLNSEYRNKHVPTDVLSFAMEEEVDEADIDYTQFDMPRLLGDIIISVEKAREQADEYGHSFMRELAFLAVHGFLHLLGYDHETAADEKEMFQKQKDILHAYGFER